MGAGIAALALAVFAASLLGTRLVMGLARRRAFLDIPNHRSSHSAPTPKGGGLAVVPALVAGWAAAALLNAAPAGTAALLLAATALAALSWWDDLRDLPPGLRLVIQAAAVAAGVAALPAPDGFFGGLLPPWADRLAAALAWLWFVNLYNFMDGIDGITTVETVTIGGGVALVASAAAPALAAPGVLMAAAALGFLWWNRPPARIFLGDVGSVPLGFLAGALLLSLCAAGAWAAAAILPAYYLADATVTLLRRAARGEKVWRPHREHFYQRAVRAGRSHGRVSAAVAVAGAALAGLAALAVAGRPVPAVALAAAVVAALIAWMARPRGGADGGRTGRA